MSWVFVAVSRLSLVVASGGYPLVVMHRLLIVVSSLGVVSGSWASVVVAHGLSSSIPCGIFPDRD